MIRTYVDANLLITAFRDCDAGVAAALAVLDDARRVFVASAFLRLEVLRKPLFYQWHDEVRFMEAFCARVNEWVPIDDAFFVGQSAGTVRAARRRRAVETNQAAESG